MKKILAIILSVVCMVAGVMGLSGCGNSQKENEDFGPAAVCYAIASTANSQGLNMNSPLVQNAAYDTILGYGYISVVCIDGNPEIVAANSYDIADQYKNASKEKLKTDARSKAAALISFMEMQIANNEQVDYLEGLRTAARSLHSLEGYKSKMIVMMGTGLSTQGILNFKNNLLSVEPEVVLDLLQEKNAIPDLSGIKVVWQQLGDVAEPQQPLTPDQTIRLQEIWKGIVQRGGGTFVYNDIMSVPIDTNKAFPAVDPVELPQDQPLTFDEKMLQDNTMLQGTVILTEQQVSFKENLAEYLNKEAALEIIRPIAEYLSKDNEKQIILAGTTAGDENDDFSMELSKQRAETVKSTLVELGVDESRITAIGLGCSDPWHVYGAGYEGSAASGNRKVVLLDASGDQAKNLMNG